MTTATATEKSLTEALFKSRGRETPVKQLVTEIEGLLKGTGYTLSRWQSNGSGRSVTIHWGIHSGDRPDQFRWRNEDLFLDWTRLEQVEGTTERCEAYRGLTGLLETAKELTGNV